MKVAGSCPILVDDESTYALAEGWTIEAKTVDIPQGHLLVWGGHLWHAWGELVEGSSNLSTRTLHGGDASTRIRGEGFIVPGLWTVGEEQPSRQEGCEEANVRGGGGRRNSR